MHGISERMSPSVRHLLCVAIPTMACAGTDEGKLQVEEAKSRAGQCSTECEQPGDRPLIVLTAGKFWAPAGLEKESTEFHDVWVHQLQASLVHLSTHGRQTIVDADHGMSEAPDAVVIAIQQVVEHGCHHSMFGRYRRSRRKQIIAEQFDAAPFDYDHETGVDLCGFRIRFRYTGHYSNRRATTLPLFFRATARPRLSAMYVQTRMVIRKFLGSPDACNKGEVRNMYIDNRGFVTTGGR